MIESAKVEAVLGVGSTVRGVEGALGALGIALMGVMIGSIGSTTGSDALGAEEGMKGSEGEKGPSVGSDEGVATGTAVGAIGVTGTMLRGVMGAAEAAVHFPDCNFESPRTPLWMSKTEYQERMNN